MAVWNSFRGVGCRKVGQNGGDSPLVYLWVLRDGHTNGHTVNGTDTVLNNAFVNINNNDCMHDQSESSLTATEHGGRIGRALVSCSRLWVPTLGRVKPMTYNIDTCRFLAKCSALLGQGKDPLSG